MFPTSELCLSVFLNSFRDHIQYGIVIIEHRLVPKKQSSPYYQIIKMQPFKSLKSNFLLNQHRWERCDPHLHTVPSFSQTVPSTVLYLELLWASKIQAKRLLQILSCMLNSIHIWKFLEARLGVQGPLQLRRKFKVKVKLGYLRSHFKMKKRKRKSVFSEYNYCRSIIDEIN